MHNMNDFTDWSVVNNIGAVAKPMTDIFIYSN